MKNNILIALFAVCLLCGCSKEEGENVSNDLMSSIVYYNLQTDDWKYLFCNEKEQLLIYKESDTGIVAFGIDSPTDSNGFYFTINDSCVSITSDTANYHVVMNKDSVLVIINREEDSRFYRFGLEEVFSTQKGSRKLDNCDILSALFSEIVNLTIGSNPVYAFIQMVGVLKGLDDVSNSSQYLDWLEHRNYRYDNIFKWAKQKEREHKSIPTVIAGVSTGESAVQGVTANCTIDGYIELIADVYFQGTLKVIYGICYSTSPSPTISDSRQFLSVTVGDGTLSQTAMLPYSFCLSGLEESTTYYYRAFYQIDALDELVYGEVKHFTTEGLCEIIAEANPLEGGAVVGIGRYPTNTEITLSAIANDGFEFSHWDDGSVSSSRNIIVQGDATFIAYFNEVPPSLPDLSGLWTFNQTLFSERNLQLNMRLDSSTESSATYRSFWGANTIYLSVSSDRSMSISVSGPYGNSGYFAGTFNSDFTSASGVGYSQTLSWNTTVYSDDPWSITR